MSHGPDLGKIIEGDAVKDAVHIAVAPVIATCTLNPGEHIGFMNDGTGRAGKLSFDVRGVHVLIGIVDPYLGRPVQKGERFWMFLYPRTVTDLRHDWNHPEFKAEAEISAVSWLYMHEFADKAGMTYNQLIEGARKFQNGDGEMDCEMNNVTSQYEWDIPEEFWRHYEKATGEKVTTLGTPFTCCPP